MSKENMWKAMVATKQLEIDKLKRILKEKENELEDKRINEGGWNNESRLRNTKNRKENKRSKPSDVSDK
tara:strand:- start:490 stop:696 length:207 start_codon:yes stop_codon:yes gene_type:complete